MPAAISTIAASTTPVTLAAADATRIDAVIINDSPQPMRVSNGVMSQEIPGRVPGGAPTIATITFPALTRGADRKAIYTAVWLGATASGSAYVVNLT